jgi:hypothetical protein
MIRLMKMYDWLWKTNNNLLYFLCTKYTVLMKHNVLTSNGGNMYSNVETPGKIRGVYMYTRVLNLVLNLVPVPPGIPGTAVRT